MRGTNFSAEPIRFFLWSSVNILGTQRAHNFLYPNFRITASWIVVLDTSGMMWCNSLIVTRRFARISPSVSWKRSSEIKDGLPLCSSWTSVLPSENSRHHYVTFCRFISLPQTATICWWISVGSSRFALRNRMTECTSHLAGLWIGAAISNMSHSNKAGSTIVKRARLTGKGTKSTAVLPQ